MPVDQQQLDAELIRLIQAKTRGFSASHIAATLSVPFDEARSVLETMVEGGELRTEFLLLSPLQGEIVESYDRFEDAPLEENRVGSDDVPFEVVPTLIQVAYKPEMELAYKLDALDAKPGKVRPRQVPGRLLRSLRRTLSRTTRQHKRTSSSTSMVL